MSSVDSRIVTMKFDNATFERDAAKSMSTLAKVKESLNFGSVSTAATKSLGVISSTMSRFGLSNPFSKSTQGIAEMQGAANKFTMSPVEGAVTGVSKSFVAMSTIAITALAQVSQSVLAQAGNMGKNLVGIQAMADGWSDYGLKINATQTIMAGTGDSIGFVQKQLKELDIYADQTIYSLSDMTSNISKFTNAGVDLKTSVNALKGVAQVAAVSGANSNEAARAMYNLGQAIGQGHVKLMDWKSVELANMGTVEFKQQLIDTAVEMGTLTKAGDGLYKTLDGTEVTTKNFSTTLEKQWLTAEALTETLGRYADKNTDIGKKAYKAATQVKTFSMMMETLSAAAGTGWTDSFEILVGNLPKATKMWTAATDAIGGVIGQSADARNKILKDWAKFGGRTAMIESISNIWKALGGVLGPIKEAFRDIFPAKSGEDLANLTKRFEEFTQKLIPGKETMEDIKRTFSGVFAIFSIAGQIIGGIVDMFKRLFGAVGDGAGGFLNFTGNIGDFLVAIDDMLKKSGVVTAFFEGLGDILAIPLKLLAGLGGLFVGLFTGFDASGADKIGDALGSIGEKINPLAAMGERIKEIFTNIGEVIGEALGKIGDVIAGAFTAESFSKSLDIINTGLLGALVIMIKNFMSNGVSIDMTGGLFDSIKETLGSVTGALENMQTSIKADIIMKIAIALGILAASIFVLATIDPKRLASALTGMAIGFAGLQIALVRLSQAIGYIGLAKLPIISAAIVALATAMLIFAGAMKIMASIDLADMLKGLFGFGAMIFILTKAVGPLSKNSKGMFRAAAGILVLAVAMNVMAVALKIFATMSWEEMARGLTAMAGALVVVIGAMRLMPKGMLLQAAALVAIGVALNAMGTALKIFGSMKWDEIGRGLVAMAGALVIIAGAMRLMPKGMLLQAVALNAVATALNIMGLALKNMGGMSWDEITKGLVTLAGGLAILAAGLHLMNGTLGGAAALVVATGALMFLVPVLITLGNLEWSTIITGLTALAGIFAVLGIAGYVLGPLVPVILGLSAALLIIGAGLALIGVGALAAATAFSLVVASGMAGVQILAAILGTFINSIPAALAAFGKGIVEFAKAIAAGGPAFFNAFSKILESMLKAVIKNVPLMGKAFTTLILTALKVIVTLSPRIFAAGIALILGFLNAINKNISKIVDIAASIIVKFLDGIARNLSKVIQSGVNLIIKFIEGVAQAIRNNSAALGEAGADLGLAMIEGLAGAIAAGAGRIRDAAVDAAKQAWEAAKDFLKINSPSRKFEELGAGADEGMADGFKNNADLVAGASEGVARNALDVMRLAMRGASDAMAFEADMNPTIAPVLDLTQLRDEAGKIGGIFGPNPMVTAGVYGQAEAIANDYLTAQDAASSSASSPVVKEIKLEQNNYSPKALSVTEIYRNTKNQISLAKEALNA